jgi:hypothetical protein
MTYKNTTDQPVSITGPPLTIEPGKSADLTEGQLRQPQTRRAINLGLLVAA